MRKLRVCALHHLSRCDHFGNQCILRLLVYFQMEDGGVRERDRGQDGQDRSASAHPGRKGRGGAAAATGTNRPSENITTPKK